MLEVLLGAGGPRNRKGNRLVVFFSVKIDEFRSKRNAGVERIHAQKHTHTHTHIETHYCRGDVSSLSGVVRKLNFIVIGFFSGFYFVLKTLFSIIRVTFACWPCFAITKIYNVHICI